MFLEHKEIEFLSSFSDAVSLYSYLCNIRKHPVTKITIDIIKEDYDNLRMVYLLNQSCSFSFEEFLLNFIDKKK